MAAWTASDGRAPCATKLTHNTVSTAVHMRAHKTMFLQNLQYTLFIPIVTLLRPLYNNYSSFKHSFFRGHDEVGPNLTPYDTMLLDASPRTRGNND